MNNYTKPIMPPNMKWYKFLRAIASIGGVAGIILAIIALMEIVYLNLGYEIKDILDIGTNPLDITMSALIDAAYGILLLWLYINMPYLTKKVYTVLTCYMWILISLHGFLMLSKLIAFSIVEDETLLSDSIVYLFYLIYSILNLIYFKKRKKYFIYETKVGKKKDNVSNNAQAYIVHFSCLCSNCGKNIKAKYRLKQNSSSTPTVSVNCPQCQTRNTVRINLPSDYASNASKNQLKHTVNKKKSRYITITILSLLAITLLIILSFTPVKYIGNSNSMKFHKRSCGHLPVKENQVYYRARENAIKDGMDPCQICDP